MHMHCLGVRVTGAVAAIALAVAGPGCGGSDEGLTVGAAASLRSVLPPLAPSARMSFAGSDTIAAQIVEGAPIDVFVSADASHVGTLADAGLVDHLTPIASNALTIIVPKANPAHISRAADLARPGVKLVLAQATVPAGRYARHALTRMGLAAALGNVVSNEDAVTGVVAKVRLGEADAGIVYVTDATMAAADVTPIAIPTVAQPSIVYMAAVVRATRRRPAAEALVAKLAGAEGQAALGAAGFRPSRAIAQPAVGPAGGTRAQPPPGSRRHR